MLTGGMANAGIPQQEEQQGLTSGNWEMVGGLEDVVKQLKEMVLFPLIYPEIFKQLGVIPPRSPSSTLQCQFVI